MLLFTLLLLASPALAQNNQPPGSQPPGSQRPSTNNPDAPADGNVLKVLEAERLELRNEGGEDLVILSGSPVRMDRNGESIQAERVLFNRTAKRLQLLGKVRYVDKQGQVIEADELELNTADESFEAISVKIDSGDFYLSGPVCQRAAGQIFLSQGYLTPCERCEQEVNDYSFTAEEVLLYPGDRIIARGVWVMLKEQRQMYLPVLLLFLNDRRPKLEFGQNAADGTFVLAELPYVTDFGLGFTLLRYFETRGWGIGFDHFGIGPAKERYQFLYLPPPANAKTLPETDPTKDGILRYNLSYQLGQNDSAAPLLVDGLITRNDGAGLPATEPGRTGDLTEGRFREGQADKTNFRLQVQTRSLEPGSFDPTYRLRLEFELDNNLTSTPNEPQGVQYLPELEARSAQQPWRDESGFQIQSWSILAGYYRAASNPTNRSARLLGPFIGAGRLQISHNTSFTPNAPPWPGLSYQAANQFVGNYYTTQNPGGEVERIITWSTTANINQTAGGFRVGLDFSRRVIEGESPFESFELGNQRPSKNTTLKGDIGFTDPLFSLSATTTRDLEKGEYQPAQFSLALNPATWLRLSSGLERDIQNGKWGLLTSSLVLSPNPFALNLSYSRNLELGLDRSFSLSSQYNPAPWGFSLNTGYQWTNVESLEKRTGLCAQPAQGQPGQPAQQNCILEINRYNNLVASASYAPQGFSSSLSHNRDLNNGQAVSTTLNLNQPASVDNPGGLFFGLQQTLNHLYFPLPQPGQTVQPQGIPLSLSGSANLGFGLHNFAFNNNVVLLDPRTGFGNFQTAGLSLGYNYAAGQYAATLSGTYNLRFGFWINPLLTLTAKISEPSYVVQNVSAVYHFAELYDRAETPEDDRQPFLRSLAFQGEAEILPAPLRPEDPPGLSLQGSLNLDRNPTTGRFGVNLREFGPTFSFMGLEQTRVFYRILWNTQGQQFFLPNLEGTILKPRLELIIDRCCWAFRSSLDFASSEFKFSLVLGGDGADFFFNERQFGLPGGITFPTPGRNR
ncbi:MAG: LPS-assembly protein LptD [Meiothermus sp.]|nr:LPS-assembly protein LptD [Meiothermus sp.]